MQKKDRSPKSAPSECGWIVYILRCGDGTLYTGITNDLTRRFRQHNAGTAAKYTRSRLPVILAHQEAHPDRSAALKREAAIKSMPRRHKLALMRERNIAAP